MIIVLMGVSGSGKTTIGTLLADRLHALFADADAYHSAANKAKMAAGHPLTDEDREPWLHALNTLLRTWSDGGIDGILACSALKQTYRTALVTGIPEESVHFVFLDGPRELIAQRLAVRHDHYMNPALLDSQMATLEVPADALRIVNDQASDKVVDTIFKNLAL